MTRHATPATAIFTGAAGNRLVADVFGEQGAAGAAAAWRRPDPPCLARHRRAHRRSAARSPMRSTSAAMAIPNGSPTASYAFSDFAADAARRGRRAGERARRAPPVVVGASLGGIAALLAEGAAARRRTQPAVLRARAGRHHAARRCRRRRRRSRASCGRMRAEGFASIDEAADAVAAYLPHRPRPRSHEGLKKNLRLRSRRPLALALGPALSRWPAPGRGGARGDRDRAGRCRAADHGAGAAGARRLRPNWCSEAHAREFLELVPHAEYVDVAGARHMVAGDRNDQFSTAMLEFPRLSSA